MPFHPQCLPFNASPDLYRLQTFRPNFSRPALLLKFFIPNFEILFQIPILYIEKAGGGGRKEASKLVRECPATKCPLHPFRLGKNPYHKLNLTPEQRKRRSDLAKERFIGKSVSFKSEQI